MPPRLLVLALADLTVTALALLLALAAFYPGTMTRPLAATALQAALAALVVMVCLHYYDLYETRVAASPRETAARVSQVLGTASVILALFYFADPRVRLRGGVLLAGVLLVGAALLLDRRMFSALNRSPRLAQRVLFVGGGELAAELTCIFARRPELATQVTGYVGERGKSGAIPWLGELDRLPALAECQRAHRCLLVLADGGDAVPPRLVATLKRRGYRVESAAELYERVTGKVASHAWGPNAAAPLAPRERARLARRAASLLCAAVALALAWPLMLLVALAIRLESPGPVIFRQKRIGRGGRAFTLYKFRSMWADADHGGAPRPVQVGDPRLTRVGRWIRRCRLDELPQLWNIARGDLHIVGPRPFVPEQEFELAEQIPFYRLRWGVQPGATGWAQVQRGYCATREDNAEKLAFDLFYIKHQSLGLDLFIVLQTFKILLLGRGAR